MNKLPMAMLAGVMAMSTCALAAPPDDQAPPTTPKKCSELSGKEKDKCIQATPAGPVDMKSGEKGKGKSEVAKDRDRAKAEDQAASDQYMDPAGEPKQQPPTDEAQAASKTEKNASDGKTQ